MVEIIIVGAVCLIVGYLVGVRIRPTKQIQSLKARLLTHDGCRGDCTCYDRGYKDGWRARE